MCPTGRRGQGNAQARLQRLFAVERHPRAIFQQGNHAPGRRVVLLFPWRPDAKISSSLFMSNSTIVGFAWTMRGCHGNRRNDRDRGQPWRKQFPAAGLRFTQIHHNTNRRKT